MHGCLRIYLCTACMRMLGVGGGQDRDQIPWDWSYRLQWAAMWVLRLEPMSSGRIASPLDRWAFSPALIVCPKEQHIFFSVLCPSLMFCLYDAGDQRACSLPPAELTSHSLLHPEDLLWSVVRPIWLNSSWENVRVDLSSMWNSPTERAA